MIDPERERHMGGQTCPEQCGRRVVARYTCKRCDYYFDVPGALRWEPQGQGHFHREDDPGLLDRLLDHINTHDPHSAMTGRLLDEG